MGIAAILGLINAAIPTISNLWVLIHNSNGTVTPVVLLNQADAEFAANLKQISDWSASHPTTATKPAA